MSDRNTDYPHTGVIPEGDEFWYSLERELTNEDYFRMTGTATEYDAYLAEAERQDGIDHSPPASSFDQPVQEWEDGVLYTLIDGEWVAEGAQPIGGGDAYYEETVETFDATWQLAVAQAERGNYLEPIG